VKKLSGDLPPCLAEIYIFLEVTEEGGYFETSDEIQISLPLLKM
jgi:hypothetical protein